MTSIKLIASTSLIALLAACGGGSTGGGVDANGINTDPVGAAEIESLINDVASIGGAGENPSVNTLALLGEGLEGFDESLLDFDTLEPRDLTAGGSATYTGLIVLADVFELDLFGSDDDDPEIFVAAQDPVPGQEITLVGEVGTLEEEDDDLGTFAVLGRSVMNVSFGADPEITGGANGFVGLNLEDAEAAAENIELDENTTFASVVDQLPLVNVDGSLTYSGGEIIPAEDLVFQIPGLGFDVNGSLTLPAALTGADGSTTANLSGEGVAAFANSIAIGGLALENTDSDEEGGFAGVIVGVSQ